MSLLRKILGVPEDLEDRAAEAEALAQEAWQDRCDAVESFVQATDEIRDTDEIDDIMRRSREGNGEPVEANGT